MQRLVTSRRARTHSHTLALPCSNWRTGRASAARESPPTTAHSLSRSAIISGGGDYRETPPHRRYKKNPVLSFLLLCSIFPLAATGRSLRSHLSRGGRAYLSHRSSTWPHGTAVQQLTLIVVRTVELSSRSSPVVYSPATADQQWKLIMYCCSFVKIDY